MRPLSIVLMECAAVAALLFGGGPNASDEHSAYNVSSEMVIKGSVSQVTTHYHGSSIGAVHLRVETARGEYEVHIGPPYFLKWRQFSFSKGDQVEIVAAKGHESHYLARKVTKGSRTLTLRDASGAPLWKQAAGH